MVRIIMGSPFGESHLSGADGLARALRDAGHEVVWAGPGLSPAQLAATAVQEDVALVAIAVPAGDEPAEHRVEELEREVGDLLTAYGASDVGVRVLPAGTSPAEATAWADAAR